MEPLNLKTNLGQQPRAQALRKLENGINVSLCLLRCHTSWNLIQYQEYYIIVGNEVVFESGPYSWWIEKHWEVGKGGGGGSIHSGKLNMVQELAICLEEPLATDF